MRIEEIEKRLSKSTPGRWQKLMYTVYAKSNLKEDVFDVEIADLGSMINDLSHDQCEANADLVANAPADLRFLLDEVKHLKKRGDGHWDTLKAILQMEDIEQIKRWVRDSGSGYVETVEETVFSLQKERDQLRACLQHALDLGHLGEGSTANWARELLKGEK
jgi:hypothetical protein